MKLPEEFVHVPEEFVGLMDMSWAENPASRPSIGYIKSLLHRHNKESDTGIMDTMVKKMESYTSNLEGLVAKRTHELDAEKKRTNELLYKMLPGLIANKMINGDVIYPDNFELVTIFFSDIVQFTRLASASTPVQIIQFLNELYSMFDDIISTYDVYKVETIGDSYMVVSGAPERNGDKHAGAISDMALHIMEKVDNFKIRHMPNSTLKLRIGIHTGPCCAGVVGTTMPRYCLYGDTVITAARMESHGQEQKIHISEPTAVLLKILGTYQVEQRGAMEIKGKGKMMTYWLEGNRTKGTNRRIGHPDIVSM
ncbi:hypothetical protein ScPMuIL_005301 [Solemya velum]